VILSDHTKQLKLKHAATNFYLFARIICLLGFAQHKAWIQFSFAWGVRQKTAWPRRHNLPSGIPWEIPRPLRLAATDNATL